MNLNTDVGFWISVMYLFINSDSAFQILIDNGFFLLFYNWKKMDSDFKIIYNYKEYKESNNTVPK